MNTNGQGEPYKIPVRVVENKAKEQNTTVSLDTSAETATAMDDKTTANDKTTALAADAINWQDTALRLQAEMDNFRKRQQRRADQAIAAERERLLTIFLPIIDNLERALVHQDKGDKTVRQGVELTHRELTRLLESEGVTRLETIGQLFDPEWHEAITTIPTAAEPDTIVEEVEAGYKLGDKLLRPARVVVAA